MKTKDLQNKSTGEIVKMVYEKREALRTLRSNLGGTKSKNVKEVANLRKDIARLLTAKNTAKAN